MDSALSSNQNEQVVSKNGKASSENTDRENEFEDNQHLLYGGASASAPEQKTESNMAVGARPGQPLQHARESTESLNLVALAGLAETVKADGRPPSSTPTYESGLSNPLPAIAKTGVAATLGLQAPTSDNAIPAGRRSGATDKIAIQLADDVAARPAMGQEIQLSQLDRDTKHRIVNASVNNLFERLGQPVPSGPADENARPIAVTAATRRSNSGENQVATVTTPARTDIRPASETPSGTRTAAELMATRAAAEVKPEAVIPPATRSGNDVRIVFGTVIQGAPLENQSTTNGARRRSPDEVGDTTFSANSNAPRNRATSDTGSIENPTTYRTPIKQVVENTGTQFAQGTITGDLLGINRAAAYNRASIPDQPLSNPRFPAPAETTIKRAGTIEAYPGVQTPALTELSTPRNGRTPAEQQDAQGTTGSRLAEQIRVLGNPNAVLPPASRSELTDGRPGTDKPATPSSRPPNVMQDTQQALGAIIGIRSDAIVPNSTPAASRDIRQAALNMVPVSPETNSPALPIVNRPGSRTPDSPETSERGDAQQPGRYVVIGEKLIYTGAKPGAEQTTNPSNPANPRSVATENQQPRIENGSPRVENAGTTIRNDATQTNVPGNRAGEIVVATRAAESLPADKNGRPVDPSVAVDRNGVRIVDAANMSTNPVATANNGAGAERGLPRTTDTGVAGEKSARAGETFARASETVARNGETVTRAAETIARNGETVTRAAETIARNSEQFSRGGESVRTADGTTRFGADSLARKEDGTSKTAESANKASESVLRSNDTGVRISDTVAKIAEPTFRANETARQAETIAKVADNGKPSEKVDIAAKLTDLQVKATSDVVPAGKPLELQVKAANEPTSIAKASDAKVVSEISAKVSDAVLRTNEVKVQDLTASSGQFADRSARLSDVIVRAAEQAIIRGSENQPIKLENNVRVSDQNAVNQNAGQLNLPLPGNQMIAGIQQQSKNDAVRNDVNAAKCEQNQIAQNNGIGGRNVEPLHVQQVKQSTDQQPVQKNVDVKVDQVVADILNHVRHNSKDQQAGAKVLSSIDQANMAANQQAEPKALLDAAAVRRILDGQGITLSPSALNTLMEGIQPTGDHPVDYALPSIGSLNLSQIISLGERLQEAVAGAGNETSEPQAKPQLQQHRTKYLVKEGDTLESIAQEKLGDARLVQLLITINRALVNYRLEGEKKVAYVVPNQYMWLPTDHELDIHKRNFFGKHGKDGSIALAINSKQNTPIIPPVSFDHTKEVSVEISGSMQDFRPAVNSSNSYSGNRMAAGYEVKKSVPSAGSPSRSNSDSGAAKMSGNLDRLRHAGERKSVNLEEIEFTSTQVSHRQCYQVREGESLMSIAASLESMGHISMWKLLARINGFQIEEGGSGKPAEKLHAGQFIVLPTTEELNEYKLLEKLTSTSKSAAPKASVVDNAFSCVLQQKQIDAPPPPALIALAQGVGGLSTVQRLSNFTRLVFNDLPQLENCFSVTVEARWNGQWKPMASYECRHGQTTRHLYNKHGEIKSMELDLPPYVVKEMAKEDFLRNWNAYVSNFMGDVASV